MRGPIFKSRAEDLYRIRVGQWRITDTLCNQLLIVLIVAVAPRGGRLPQTLT